MTDPARPPPLIRVERLVNGSTGDPALYLDFPGTGNAILCDAGENEALARADIADLAVLLVSHHHPDHLSGLGRVIRYASDQDREVAVIGPPGTIDALEHALRAFVHLDFPFMKLVLVATDVDPAAPTWPTARFARVRGFVREPLPARKAPKDGVVVRTPEARIRCAAASHTIPCLSYAIDVVPGWRWDAERAASSPLKPGPWVGTVLAAARLPRASRPETIALGGGIYPLAELLERHFRRASRTVRIAFVTDTRKDPATWDGLVELARGADRLYCDAYYRDADATAAARYGHLTAREAGELAREASVSQLWLMHLGPRYRGRYDELVAEARQAFGDVFALLPHRQGLAHEPRDD